MAERRFCPMHMKDVAPGMHPITPIEGSYPTKYISTLFFGDTPPGGPYNPNEACSAEMVVRNNIPGALGETCRRCLLDQASQIRTDIKS